MPNRLFEVRLRPEIAEGARAEVERALDVYFAARSLLPAELHLHVGAIADVAIDAMLASSYEREPIPSVVVAIEAKHPILGMVAIVEIVPDNGEPL